MKHISHSNVVICKGLTCDEPLLDGTNPVPDSYFTASSEHHVENAAHRARLYSSAYGWVANAADRDAITPTLFLQASSH